MTFEEQQKYFGQKVWIHEHGVGAPDPYYGPAVIIDVYGEPDNKWLMLVSLSGTALGMIHALSFDGEDDTWGWWR